MKNRARKRTDTERLDWMSGLRKKGDTYWGVDDYGAIWSYGAADPKVYRNLRQAIDAAMASERKAKGERG